MSYQVALSFEDGVTRFITCKPDQTVADASYRQRINIPLDCRDGACGTCKAKCVSGEYDGGTYIDDALTAAEAEDGFALPCSMKPLSDLVLEIASTSAIAKTSAARFAGTVADVRRLSSTTYALAVEIKDRARLTFLPGQYVNIEVPGTDDVRSYSFSNAPDEGVLTFLIKITPGGAMSDYLTERAAVGDSIAFTGPHGSFFLRETERPVLLLAGGTGLAPILSILQKMRDDEVTRPVHLVYGVSTDEDLVEIDAIEGLVKQMDSLTWDHVVADPDSSAPNTGYVMSLLTEEHLHGGDLAVYLCGPPPMVEAVRTHFRDEGLEPAGFYYEKFALASTPAEAEAATGAPVEDVDAAGDESATDKAPKTPAAELAPDPLTPEPRSTLAEQRWVADDHPDPAARKIAGQVVWPERDIEPLTLDITAETTSTGRAIAGQTIFALRGDGATAPVLAGGTLVPSDGGHSIAGQRIWTDRDFEPLYERALKERPAPEPSPAASAPGSSAGVTTGDGYEIGEEHPSIHESDAIFEARQALELGAVELTIGRLTSQQIVGYRLLAEATLPYVEDDHFVDAAAYTETNAAFHDYLFAQTGNQHLLAAYQALGVKGHMAETLRDATWCHPQCATEHVEIVEAFENQDRALARELIIRHADHSKETTRRAMDEAAERSRPRFVTPNRFAGKVVVVTGAAQGIGETVVNRLAAEGASLVLADRSDLVEVLGRRLETAGTSTESVVADLETWDGCHAVVQAAMKKFGRVDVAIHTVGGTIWAKPFAEYGVDEIEQEISRSLFPTLWGCRAVAPVMVEQGFGTIVNVSSIATRGINRVPYAAAKGGVNAITSSLAIELAEHGIRVVATAPGGTDAPPRRVPRGPAPQTDQEKEWYREIVDQTVDSSLLKRYGSLDEQAAAICFLASEEASYITASVLPVAGGDLG